MKLIDSKIFFKISLLIIISLILVLPIDTLGINNKMFINQSLVVNVKYIIVGILTIIYLIVERLKDNNNHKLYNLRLLVSRILYYALFLIILISLSSSGLIKGIIPTTFFVLMYVKILLINFLHKNNRTIKKENYTINPIFIIGLILTLFYNLPFELFNLKVSDFILLLGVIIALVELIDFYELNKKQLFKIDKIEKIEKVDI